MKYCSACSNYIFCNTCAEGYGFIIGTVLGLSNEGLCGPCHYTCGTCVFAF